VDLAAEAESTASRHVANRELGGPALAHLSQSDALW
jgi:hypothetical protein